MERYRIYTQEDDQPLTDGDTGFIGVNSFDTIDSLQPGQVQAAVNMDFTTQTSTTRGGFVCIPSLGAASFNITSPWTSRAAAADKIYRGVAYGNGRFVAVATLSSGTNDVMYSIDGVTWTAVSTGISNSWQCLAFGGGLFVAVASSGVSGSRVATSPDGINWTARFSAADLLWRAVTYGNGLFVAVAFDGGSNQVMTSPDGVTWTLRAAGNGSTNWTGVTYGAGQYVAVGSADKRAMTSPDGFTWTLRTALTDNWSNVAFGAGVYVAVSSSASTSSVMTSPDGISWQLRTTPNASWSAIAYGNGLFAAVGDSGNPNTSVMTSPSGAVWTAGQAPTSQVWLAAVNGNNTFVAVAFSTALVMTKSFATTPNSTGVVLASGIYSDPNDAGSQWIMLVGTSQVGFYASGRTARTILYGAGLTVTQQSTVVQCNNVVYIFRGSGLTPLYWNGSWSGTFTTAPQAASPGPGFGSIPNSNQATFYQNRLWVIDGKDNVASSDILDFTSYDLINNEFNLNTGSSDYLITTYPFGSTTLIAFKNKSIYAMTAVSGALTGVVSSEITRQVGIIGINATVSVGSDVVYMSDRNINLLSLTDTNNALQHQTLPLSRNIQSIIQRVNWAAANKVSMAYWDNKLYVALPLDNSTVCNSVAVYNFVTGQWFGEWNFSSAIAMAIQSWVVVTYLGATRLHAVTEDGRIFVAGYGQNDISGAVVADISASVTTRAYRFNNNSQIPRRMYVDLATNRPNYSLSASSEGASETETTLANQTYSRANSWLFNDTAYVLSNANDDYNRSFRQDYSTGPNSIQCGSGFQPEMLQNFRLPVITRRKGRLAWLTVSNTSGVIAVNGAGFESRPGDRGNLTQVG